MSHESDEDLLEEPVPEELSSAGAAIVVQSYRPAQVTWSQLPEVGAAAQPKMPSRPCRGLLRHLGCVAATAACILKAL